MHRVLIIDDDHSLFELLRDYLGSAGFDCAHAADGDAGLDAIARDVWDAVILDVMLPGKDGHEVLRLVRDDASRRDLPILMLTARGEEDDKVLGFELGADDYLAKPFGPKELVARLRALLRRTDRRPTNGTASPEPLRLDDLVIDRGALLLTRGGERVPVTAPEMRLLELFAASAGSVVGRDILCRTVFGHGVLAYDRSLDMMISRLRKKLGPRPDGGERIRAARGEGYVFLLSGSGS